MTVADAPNPKLIIAGAGMSHGGRIGRWEERYLPDAKTTLFIVGYQAPGSPGRLLQEGVKKIRIAGKEVVVRAHIETLQAWSAHADRDQLLAFADSCKPRVKTFFVGMGEPSSERFLAQRIHDYLGIRAIVAGAGDTWEVSQGAVRKVSR